MVRASLSHSARFAKISIYFCEKHLYSIDLLHFQTKIQYRLCEYAKYPVSSKIQEQLGFEKLTVGAICVYPNMITNAVQALRKNGCNIPVASVAAGFPEVITCRYNVIKYQHKLIELCAEFASLNYCAVPF